MITGSPSNKLDTQPEEEEEDISQSSIELKQQKPKDNGSSIILDVDKSNQNDKIHIIPNYPISMSKLSEEEDIKEKKSSLFLARKFSTITTK